LTSTSTKSYAYDAAGRTTGVTSGGQTTTVAYDYEDRITSITYPSTATNTFTYNGLDTRVGKVDSAGTKTYKRDGAGVTDPVLADGAANYTPEVSERRSGASSFRHTDRMGSMSRLTNSSQSTTDTRTYDAFGLLVGTTGSTATPFGFVGNQGYQSDSDSSLMLLGHRYYDPSTGRFLTRDRATAGRNWYSYCDNSPVKHLDQTGADKKLLIKGDMSGWAWFSGAYYCCCSFDQRVNQPSWMLAMLKIIATDATHVTIAGHSTTAGTCVAAGECITWKEWAFIANARPQKIRHLSLDQCFGLSNAYGNQQLLNVACEVTGYRGACPTPGGQETLGGCPSATCKDGKCCGCVGNQSGGSPINDFPPTTGPPSPHQLP
ncbi:MAG: RHS repeat-associated core domain-containing protein, partial [Fimbriimonas ginsengisoli]|nr:RHS repeat-associated core domain-containing protein [Fimbriimonas ginsengisoli]